MKDITGMTRRSALLFGAGLMILALAATARPAHAELTKVRLGFSGSAGFMAAYIAKDQGLFEKHGLDVEMHYMTKGSIIPASLIGGSLDIGIATAPTMIRTFESGMGLVALTATNVNTRDTTTLGFMVRPGLKIKSPKDLEGLRIGTPGRYGVMDTLFLKWAVDRGVDIKKLTLVEVGFAQMGDMLKSGQIDGACVTEPFVGRYKKSGSAEMAIEYMKDMPDGMVMGGFMATRKWAEANRKAALGFRAAITEAVAMYEANPSIAAPSVAKHLKLNTEIVKKLKLPKISADISKEQLEFWNEVSLKYGITRAPVDVNKIMFK